MGSSVSKVPRAAGAGAASRKYPTRSPGSTVTTPSPASRRAAAAAADAVQEAPGKKSFSKGDESKNDDVRTDAIDTDFDRPSQAFSSRLHSMGIAQPNLTFSPSSTANVNATSNANPLSSSSSSSFASSYIEGSAPAAPRFPPAARNTTLTALEARSRLQAAAEEDLDKFGRGEGRRFLDMRTLVDAIRLRENGVRPREIEKRLGIQPGLLDKFGRDKLLQHVSAD